jgi:hypothetical protein
MTRKIKKIINIRDCYNIDLSIRVNEERMNKYLLREIADNVVDIFDGDSKLGGVKYYPRINHISIYPSIRHGHYVVVFVRTEPYKCHGVSIENGKIVIYDKKIIMKPRIKNLDVIDPYNEEIWDEMDESSEFNFEFEKTIIIIRSQSEYDELMVLMEFLGFMWYKTKPTMKNYFNEYPTFSIVIDNNMMRYGDLSYFKRDQVYKLYDYVEAKDLLKMKKMRKIKNSEIDPFDEDDWGYEHVDENISLVKTMSNPIIVKVESQDEYDVLMDELKKLKYRWVGSTYKSDPKEINIYRYPIEGKGFYVYLETGKSGINFISWDNFAEDGFDIIGVKDYVGESFDEKINLIANKKNKIREMTKDFDPYEEEIWDDEEEI